MRHVACSCKGAEDAWIMEGHRASPLEGKLLLIGLGAQKAGSSWLARYLGSHPDVYVSPLKEIHYFDAVYLRRLNGHFTKQFETMAKEIARDIATDNARVSHADKVRYRALKDRMKMTRGKSYPYFSKLIDRITMACDENYPYLRYFEDRVTSESVFCDITPAYSMLNREGYQAIMDTHPNIRWVFVLRDPVDRYWSAIRMEVRANRNFDPYREFMKFLDLDGYRLRSDYKRTILELERLVPPDRIKYLFYEKLFTAQAVDELTSFIGVKSWPAKFKQVVGPGIDLPIRPEHHVAAVEKFRHIYEFVLERFGHATPERWRKSMDGVTSTG
jgi:hypothetical protein